MSTIPTTVHHMVMRVMVYIMRIMTRHLGFVARPLVRLYAASEVIACGIRDLKGNILIIFTHNQLHRDTYRIHCRTGRKWHAVELGAKSEHSDLYVRQIALPHAKDGEQYKLKTSTVCGIRISSPTILVKQETVTDPLLLHVEILSDRTVRFNWEAAEKHGPMIYFFLVKNDKGESHAAIYTREHFWTYPEIKKASYSVGPASPPMLSPNTQYAATLFLVDFDGWVSHKARQEFII